MTTFRRTCTALVGVMLGSTLLASDDNAEVTPDVATHTNADVFHAPTRLRDAEDFIDSGISHGHSGPTIADVDGDGVKDLVVGDFSGLFRLYHNSGTNQKPRYETSVNLQAGGEDAKVRIY